MQTESRELELYVTNVESYIAPVWKTLGRHYKKGNFSYEKALSYIDKCALIPGAKQYTLEFGSMTTSWKEMFPKSVRNQAAESILDSILDEFRLGNFWD